MRRIKVFHCISSLWGDGAQRVLFRLLTQLNPEEFESHIINLREETSLAQEFQARGIQVHSFNLQFKLGTFTRLFALMQLIRKEKPDVIQGWMEHGNLLASFLATQVRPRPTVLWNIRRSLYSLATDKLSTRVMVWLNALTSRSAKRIIFCARESMKQYGAKGFSLEGAVWIPNGFEIERFKPRPDAHEKLCSLINVPPSTSLIGSIGRYHPHKDHLNLLNAAALMQESRSDVHFVMIGRNVDTSNKELLSVIRRLKLEQRVHLLGARNDIPELVCGFDVLCLPSRTEGFPNVVGEAMCCQVPCVVTDCGAARELVAGIGKVVPRENCQALAQGLLELLSLSKEERNELGIRSRQRILEHYALEGVVERYRALYFDAAGISLPTAQSLRTGEAVANGKPK